MATKIEPCYVTFEQAKLLKEKGFDIPVRYGVYGRKMKMTEYVGSTRNPCQIDRNWNTPKAKSWSVPEQWQVVEWLRVEKGIWILVIPTVTSDWTYKIIRVIGEVDNDVISGLISVSDIPPYKDVCAYDFSTPQEAYSHAFDHIIENLI